MLNSTSIATRFRGALPDKETLARRWLSMKASLRNAKEIAEETATNVFVGATTFGSFSLAFYHRQRRKLAGKQLTFDKKGKVDAYFWPGLVLAGIGATPLAGKASRYVGGSGIGIMCAGATDYLSQMAAEHHAKK
jgi:hypothetical protein